ncbi:hypothetical protein IW139_003701 [Coemansia sp. RSA 353]|nr:hypothetical protein LPJ69_001887 [Coemansia sp. RSA 1752]KAJ1791377.1 hypothetical protein LPJ67_001873 [Coemansia sp. RSA 1938]KAJ2138196.1 hypothetical protein GGH17_001233 [Coemansia sp. RSA 788]KAJ2175146.1 hypothetical protein GGH16_000931 [Coemansia sp. RSA 560]KAJ2186619.1 hypothetical protein EV181_003208 [Coemansia sp. RSA 532]KAJ2194417.1 hypothetical protein IW144_003968 [Coemansia sp. RSA 522]KAJ2197106.1 hypothetical protein GGH18_001425 [Coemansia sp. RSA 530]KAJ2205443.1 h
MYSKVARIAITAGTAICANVAYNTAPVPATHHLVIETHRSPDKDWAMQAEARNASLRVQLERAEAHNDSLRVQLEQAEICAQQAASLANTLQLQVIDLMIQLKRETAKHVMLTVNLETERGIHAAQMDCFQGVAQIWADQLNGQTQLAAEYAEQYISQAKYESQVVKLAEENIAQQSAIAKLKATVEQLNAKHDDELKATTEQLNDKQANNLKSIDHDLKELANCLVKEQTQADAERDTLNKRIELAEGHVKRLEVINKLYANRAERATKRCQPYAEHDKRVDETAKKSKLASKLEQPADKHNDELAVNRVESQDKLKIESVWKAKDIIRRGMMANKLNVTRIKPVTCNGMISAAKNKLTRNKEMAHKVVELLRAYQHRRQLNNSKPESDLPTAKSQRSAIASSSKTAKLLY